MELVGLADDHHSSLMRLINWWHVVHGGAATNGKEADAAVQRPNALAAVPRRRQC
jgi:hypothetical protein